MQHGSDVRSTLREALDRVAAEGYRRTGSTERALTEHLLAAVDSSGAAALHQVVATLDDPGVPQPPDPMIYRLASDLAWRLRRNDGAIAWAEDTPTAWSARLFVVLVEAQTLRFDFRAQALSEYLAQVPMDLASDELVAALAVFARESTRSVAGGSAGLFAAVEAQLAGRTLEFSVSQVLLHALWLDLRDPERARFLLALGARMVDGGIADANVWYRMAAAHRHLGDLGAAADHISRAIEWLGPGQPEVHQDYVRERELIALADQLIRGSVATLEAQVAASRREAEERIDALREELDATLEAASAATQEAVNRSMIGVVEILAVFVTIAGVLGATGLVVLPALQGDGAWWRSLLVLAGAAVFLLGAFLLLHRTVHRPRLRPVRWGGHSEVDR